MLSEIAPDQWDAQDQIQYERLDQLITESMLYAESCAAKNTPRNTNGPQH
jgi:hypothetical protein